MISAINCGNRFTQSETSRLIRQELSDAYTNQMNRRNIAVPLPVRIGHLLREKRCITGVDTGESGSRRIPICPDGIHRVGLLARTGCRGADAALPQPSMLSSKPSPALAVCSIFHNPATSHRRPVLFMMLETYYDRFFDSPTVRQALKGTG